MEKMKLYSIISRQEQNYKPLSI